MNTEQKKKFEMSLNYFEDGATYNDAEVLKLCIKPKIIFYSTHDEFNTPKEVKEIFISISEPKELHSINCTHDYRLHPEVVEEINKKVGTFIDTHLSHFHPRE